jgi:hypothetical protein
MGLTYLILSVNPLPYIYCTIFLLDLLLMCIYLCQLVHALIIKPVYDVLLCIVVLKPTSLRMSIAIKLLSKHFLLNI